VGWGVGGGLGRQESVDGIFGIYLVGEVLEKLGHGVLEGGLDFGGDRLPVVVEEEVHSVGEGLVPVEEVLQVDARVADVEVAVELEDAEVALAGAVLLVALALYRHHDVDVRVVAEGGALARDRQHQDLPFHLVIGLHLQPGHVQLQPDAVLVGVEPATMSQPL
jgi:hypothetical protein